MAIAPLILGMIGLIFIGAFGANTGMRVLGIVMAAGGVYLGKQQFDAVQQEGKNPSATYVSLAICMIAILVGVVRSITG